ncbi:MAG TPA: hypothetical protein EYP10_01685, partial [Armatimonadetes bacterium]|nr:hypothetical protein [Armatimonadota bacterium]
MAWQHHESGYWYRPSAFGRLRFAEKLTPHLALKYSAHLVSLSTDAQVYAGGRAVKIYARIPMPIASWNWRWRIAVASPDGKAMRIATGKLTRGAVRTITRTWRIPRNADDGSYELTLALLRDDIPTITVKRTHFIIARGIASRVRNAIASAESHLKVLRNANARWLAREFVNASWRAYRNHDFATALRLARIAQAIQPHAPQYKHGARTSRHISMRIETPTYPIGPVFHAWGDKREQLERIKRYRFTAIRGGPVDVAEQLGIKVVCGIGWWGLPRELRKPLLSNRGEWRTQLGFLNVNFNYIPFRKWLEKHIPEVVRKVYGERRNILGFCVHNEFAYWAPGYYDYSEWTVARYRSWLIQRYGTIDALNRAWRTHYRDFTTIEPPRELPVKELANWIDWRTFTCWNFAEFFRFIADLVHRVRPDVPVASNFCATSSLDGWNLFELARLNDYIALDIYALSRWDANAAALDLLRSAAKAHNRPHYLWEYHAGPNNWIPKVTAYHIYVTTFQALARNLRGIIYYHWAPSGAGRERGIHGMCDSNQQPTERVTAGAEMASECQRLAHLLLRSRTPAKVAVLYSVPAIFYNVGMQKSAWEIINRVRRICQLLERIHVPFDLVEERQLKRLRTLGYNVLILSGAPLLDEADGKALIEFVRAGGAIIAFYGTAIANAHGFAYEVAPGVISRALGIRVISRKMQRVNRIIPCGTLAQRHGVVTPIPCNGVREQVEVTAHTVQVWARADGTQMPAITVNRFGRGCAIWLGCELPIENEQPIPDEVRALLRALLVESGARPPVELVNLTGETVEASLSEAYGNLLLYLIRRVERDVGAVKVFLRASAPRGIIAIYAGARRVERLPYQNVLDGIAFVVPRVDPATLVIVPRDMQPLIGLDAPEYAVAGVPFTATVTVDNFTDATLRVAMNLSAPQGWRIERLSDANVVIKPTGRGACSFKVTPPSGAPIDRFRLENVLTASATVQVRNDDGWRDVGALKCEQGVGIVPAIDFFAHYKGELLNSWQELAPPILRWGWGTDVYVPPPPPLPLGVEASIEVEVIPRTKIAKAHVRIDANGLEVHPNRFTVRGARKTKVMLKVRGKRRGRYAMVLRADYGAGELKCTVPITVRLERESLLPHLRDLERTKWHGTWRRRLPFVVGVRSAMLPDEPLQPVERAHARPRYIIAEVDAQRPATVVDASGRFVPFVWRDGKLLVPVLHSGAVSASAFIAYFDGMRNSGKPLIKFERGERTVKFITPAFDVEFDVISGAMMRIGVANEKEPLVTHAGLMLTH